MAKMLEYCPNCSSCWAPGSEEWQFQQCDCCGYPDPGCERFMDEEDDFDYGDYDEECERKNPNDSRNL